MTLRAKDPFFATLTNRKKNNLSFHNAISSTSQVPRPQTSLNNSIFYPTSYGEEFVGVSRRGCLQTAQALRFATISASERVSDLFYGMHQKMALKSCKRSLLAVRAPRSVQANRRERSLKDQLSTIIKWISRRHYIAIKRPVSKSETANYPLAAIKLNKAEVKPKPKNPHNFTFMSTSKCKANIENTKKLEKKKYKFMLKQSKIDCVNKTKVCEPKRSIVQCNAEFEGDVYDIFQQVYR
eukprot:TRINITY_DN1735_c0_g1_i7.p1 TRINITY_DN1735_c0_g1~~TRINITY_DN1735_c0_g1_i7.p1  ORF type:complete len:239 (-),score=49.49 TRINITY_DN1735_c0_g1_i7:139-855(-)